MSWFFVLSVSHPCLHVHTSNYDVVVMVLIDIPYTLTPILFKLLRTLRFTLIFSLSLSFLLPCSHAHMFTHTNAHTYTCWTHKRVHNSNPRLLLTQIKAGSDPGSPGNQEIHEPVLDPTARGGGEDRSKPEPSFTAFSSRSDDEASQAHQTLPLVRGRPEGKNWK